MIPFIDLSRQFKNLKAELTQALSDVGESGNFILGSVVENFEAQIAESCKTKHAIGVANGSDAIFLALKALNIGAGDEVITVSNSFIATAWVIVATGATPVFVDIGDDLNINPELIAAAISERTKAIIPVHLTGRPANIRRIQEVINGKSIPIIEDAAQAIGAVHCGSPVGSLGLCAGFSLHPLKNLSVLGDGGVITTNDTELASKIRLLRNHGLENRDTVVAWGYNSRLDSLQAAFGIIKLKRLGEWNLRRRQIAHYYTEKLSNFVSTPPPSEPDTHVYHNYVLMTENRSELRDHLLRHGVETKIHYPTPIHRQPVFFNHASYAGKLDRTEYISNRIISLPVFPELTDSEVEYVADSMLSYFKKDQRRI